jgi:hypothetical protein
LALAEDEWLASYSNHFTPWGSASKIHWMRDWMGPRMGLVMVAKRKINVPARNQTPVIHSTTTSYSTDSGTPSAKFVKCVKSPFMSMFWSYSDSWLLLKHLSVAHAVNKIKEQ